jgi:hypothetical protein
VLAARAGIMAQTGVIATTRHSIQSHSIMASTIRLQANDNVRLTILSQAGVHSTMKVMTTIKLRDRRLSHHFHRSGTSGPDSLVARRNSAGIMARSRTQPS